MASSSFYVESPSHLVPSTPCFRQRQFCESPDAEVPEVDLPLLPETSSTHYENGVGLLFGSRPLNSPHGQTQSVQNGNTTPLSRSTLHRMQVVLGQNPLPLQGSTSSPLRVTVTVRGSCRLTEQIVPTTPPEANTAEVCHTPAQFSLLTVPSSPNIGKSLNSGKSTATISSNTGHSTVIVSPDKRISTSSASPNTGILTSRMSPNVRNRGFPFSARSKLSLSKSRSKKQKQRLCNVSLPPSQVPLEYAEEQGIFLFGASEDDIFC